MRTGCNQRYCKKPYSCAPQASDWSHAPSSYKHSCAGKFRCKISAGWTKCCTPNNPWYADSYQHNLNINLNLCLKKKNKYETSHGCCC